MERGRSHSEVGTAERLELILHEVDSLPTLGAVAMRLLELTADNESDSREVIELVSSDPALASKVLSLCRHHERGRASQVTTVERAVLLLGFEAVRCAVLSARVFEVIDRLTNDEHSAPERGRAFDRETFWLHAIGVAVVSEQIASQGTLTQKVRPGEAFIAGLLHDLGQLVLHVLLPESFEQVCRVAETHSASLDHACRQIVGFDTHTVGKRLAEHWGFSQSLVDAIWLNGQPIEALPESPNRLLVTVVTLADVLVRARYVTLAAHWARNVNLSAMCVPVGISPATLDELADTLHESVSQRAEALGMNITHERSVLLRALSRAGESIARASVGMRQREELRRKHSTLLRGIGQFHDELSPGLPLIDVLMKIARSASDITKAPVVGAFYETPDSPQTRFVRFAQNGRVYGSRIVQVPEDTVPLPWLDRDEPIDAPLPSLLPWVNEEFRDVADPSLLRVFPIFGTGGLGRVMFVIELPRHPAEPEPLCELVQCWRTALATGIQTDITAQLTEQLAEMNRELVEAQEALSRNQTLAALGEVAAGAAHEMNNPLTVISGRAQLLATRLKDPDLHRSAQDIAAQAHRLSDMITALRSFAEPLEPERQPVEISELVFRAVQQATSDEGSSLQVNTILASSLPRAWVDADLIGSALTELVRNAAESKGSRHIELRVQTEPPDGRLKIEVRDDGSGLTEHALRHAFDPFFSAKPAGRQPGLGLARARRAVESHGGRITLVNGPSGGAVATIWMGHWQESDAEQRDAA